MVDGCHGRLVSALSAFGEDFDCDDGLRECLVEKLFVESAVERSEESASTGSSSFSYHDLGGCCSPERKSDVVAETWNQVKTTKLNSERVRLASCSSQTEWGMGCHCDRCLTRSCKHCTRLRGTDNKLHRYCPIDNRSFKFSRIGETTKIDRDQRLGTFRNRRSPVSFTKVGPTPRTVTIGFIPLTVFVLLLAWATSFGHAFPSSSCVAEQCSRDFMRAADHDKVLIGPNLPYCTLLTTYGACLNRTSRACRGDLQFHSFFSMVMTKIRHHNCTALIEYRRKMAARAKSIKSNVTEESMDENADNGNSGSSNGGRCLFPYQHQKGAGGFRYCSMFGDPHLRTFEGQYETCRTLGAWPLLDNSYFGVQVTNEPVAGGVDASGISKITVIVKSLPGCSDQKMYEATKDSLPSTFVDGTTNSGDPTTNSISGASYSYQYFETQVPENGENRPAVLVRTMESDHHVEIHLRYISTRVVIHRVGNYLTVAIKIPEEVLFQRSTISSLQVCFTGCPSSERINYKEVLAYPDYYVQKWGARSPSMSREKAVDTCRDAGVTDFFFDSCVFDLLMTGDESFKESALAAMNDIRHLYPPYRKHYETGRSDLSLYNELAKLGKTLENEDRGHKRRQPISDWEGDRAGLAGARKYRTSGGARQPIAVLLLLLLLGFGTNRLGV